MDDQVKKARAAIMRDYFARKITAEQVMLRLKIVDLLRRQLQG